MTERGAYKLAIPVCSWRRDRLLVLLLGGRESCRRDDIDRGGNIIELSSPNEEQDRDDLAGINSSIPTNEMPASPTYLVLGSLLKNGRAASSGLGRDVPQQLRNWGLEWGYIAGTNPDRAGTPRTPKRENFGSLAPARSESKHEQLKRQEQGTMQSRPVLEVALCVGICISPSSGGRAALVSPEPQCQGHI